MKTDRIYFYDNLKFILITFVVIGHFLLHILDYQISKSLFLFIYAFHMPLFIFITGFLSKRLTDKNGNFRLERILGFMILYIIFKILIYVILKFIYNQDVTEGRKTTVLMPVSKNQALNLIVPTLRTIHFQRLIVCA